MNACERSEGISQDLSETDLLASVKAGERDAFAVVVRRHTPIARRTAVLLGAGSDADDVVQEAFVKAYRALPTFREDKPFRPWLLRIVANETRNLYRSTSRRRAREHIAEDPTLLFPAIGDAADPADTAIDRERRQSLRTALLTLAEPQRTVLICRYLLDLDEAETAAVLGIARGTVKSRCHRGLRNLRACLPAEHAATLGGAADG
jgi:RNA polymerase sigma-70 factor (ECF subfamily)